MQLHMDELLTNIFVEEVWKSICLYLYLMCKHSQYNQERKERLLYYTSTVLVVDNLLVMNMEQNF